MENPVDPKKSGVWEDFKPFYEKAIEEDSDMLPIEEIERMFKAGRWEVKEAVPGFAEYAKAKGYDGFISREGTFNAFYGGDVKADEGVDVYAVFSPTQIKSIFNRGTWGPEPDISLNMTSGDAEAWNQHVQDEWVKRHPGPSRASGDP